MMHGKYLFPNGRIYSINPIIKKWMEHYTIKIFAIYSSMRLLVSDNFNHFSLDLRLFLFSDNIDTSTTTTTVSEQYKTQQLLSIVLIGIVGARYGEEVEENKQSNTLIKGFTVESPEMILKLSKNIKALPYFFSNHKC